mgnify:CR=1 FL=1
MKRELVPGRSNFAASPLTTIWAVGRTQAPPCPGVIAGPSEMPLLVPPRERARWRHGVYYALHQQFRNRTIVPKPERQPGDPVTPTKDRQRCGAKCRDGHPCRAPAVWNYKYDKPRNGRCRMHGGVSTGPRTAAGKKSVLAAMKAGRERAYRERRAARVAP